MRAGQVIIALIVLGGLFVKPACGQLANVPVYANPSASGIQIGADVAAGVNDESGKNLAFAARAHFGLGKVKLGAGIGLVDFGTTEPTFMVVVGYRIIDAGLVKLAAQVGAGFTRDNSVSQVLSSADVPVSVGLGLNIPLVVATVQPWVAPRYTIRRLSANGANTGRNHVGLSAGLDVNLVMGFGGHLALDWSALPAIDPSNLGGTLGDLKRQPVIVSGGIHFGF